MYPDGELLLIDGDGDNVLLREPQVFQIFQALLKKYDEPEEENEFIEFFVTGREGSAEAMAAEHLTGFPEKGVCEDCGSTVVLDDTKNEIPF